LEECITDLGPEASDAVVLALRQGAQVVHEVLRRLDAAVEAFGKQME
jgi:hypothetical protein